MAEEGYLPDATTVAGNSPSSARNIQSSTSKNESSARNVRFSTAKELPSTRKIPPSTRLTLLPGGRSLLPRGTGFLPARMPFRARGCTVLPRGRLLFPAGSTSFRVEQGFGHAEAPAFALEDTSFRCCESGRRCGEFLTWGWARGTRSRMSAAPSNSAQARATGYAVEGNLQKQKTGHPESGRF
jgi:hypothetical protein